MSTGLWLASACALAGCRYDGSARYASSPPPLPPAAAAANPPSPAAPRATAPPQTGWDSGARGTGPAPDVQYPLDPVARRLPDGQLSCPAVDAREFGGSSLRFSPQAKVIEPFRHRLISFEQVVRDVSQRVYGRWPSSILVAASYGCRSVGGRNDKLSEHALGNAIDITGFEFAPAVPLAVPAWAPPAATLLGGFQVRVDRHWKATGDPVSATHARFLSELTDELLARNVFRTLLGPAQPDHHEHFHFDMAPWRYVNL